MIAEMYTSTQGLIARQNELDMVANNIANVSTSGFRGSNPFVYAYNNALDNDLQNPLNGMVNDQPVLTGQYLSEAQGSMKYTGSDFDLAIDGEGYFKLQTPFGTRYTRRGHFQLDSKGFLSTEQNYYVLDRNGNRIRLTGRKTSIGSDGTIQDDGNAVARMALVTLPNPENLTPEEDVLIASTNPNQVEVPSNTRIFQGYLETSNVNIAEQMVSMITAQRNFELNNKVIKTIANDILQKMISVYGQYA